MMIFMNRSNLLKIKNNQKISPQFEIPPGRRLDRVEAKTGSQGN